MSSKIGVRRTITALIAVGALLVLGLNVAGFAIDYRGAPRPSQPPPTTDLLRGDLDRRPGESDGAYFRRVTRSVYYRMAPYTKIDDGRSHGPALTDNWIL